MSLQGCCGVVGEMSGASRLASVGLPKASGRESRRMLLCSGLAEICWTMLCEPGLDVNETWLWKRLIWLVYERSGYVWEIGLGHIVSRD